MSATASEIQYDAERVRLFRCRFKGYREVVCDKLLSGWVFLASRWKRQSFPALITTQVSPVVPLL